MKIDQTQNHVTAEVASYAMTQRYASPLGTMLLAAGADGLTGAWFVGQQYFAQGLDASKSVERENDMLAAAKRWLDGYFAGRIPDFMPPLHPQGTAFQRSVWKLLLEIPRGQVTTYGALAKKLAQQQGRGSMSAQAVGGAVGRNPVSIFIPCHRVVGADGSLTGYAGGLERKAALLRLEGTQFRCKPEP